MGTFLQSENFRGYTLNYWNYVHGFTNFKELDKSLKCFYWIQILFLPLKYQRKRHMFESQDKRTLLKNEICFLLLATVVLKINQHKLTILDSYSKEVSYDHFSLFWLLAKQIFATLSKKEWPSGLLNNLFLTLYLEQ